MTAAAGTAALSLLLTAGLLAAHRPAPTGPPHRSVPAADALRTAPVADALPFAPKPVAPPAPTAPVVHRQVEVGVPHTDVANAPHFDSPGAAMRYLAAAWNADDRTDLKHVTDPAARKQLNAMHSEATGLALNRCMRQPAGDYECYFTHGFPSAKVQHREDADGDGIGHAEFTVGPADRPGWYMTVFVGCGG